MIMMAYFAHVMIIMLWRHFMIFVWLVTMYVVFDAFLETVFILFSFHSASRRNAEILCITAHTGFAARTVDAGCEGIGLVCRVIVHAEEYTCLFFIPCIAFTAHLVAIFVTVRISSIIFCFLAGLFVSSALLKQLFR